jgi:hypothetical protein
MNNWQLQNVQDRLRIPGAMAECAGRREINAQLVYGNLRGVGKIMGEIEDSLRSDLDENWHKTDEEVIRCAGALYAGAKNGFFTQEESIEYLGDSIKALKDVLERTDQIKKKGKRLIKSILGYITKLDRDSFTVSEF